MAETDRTPPQIVDELLADLESVTRPSASHTAAPDRLTRCYRITARLGALINAASGPVWDKPRSIQIGGLIKQLADPAEGLPPPCRPRLIALIIALRPHIAIEAKLGLVLQRLDPDSALAAADLAALGVTPPAPRQGGGPAPDEQSRSNLAGRKDPFRKY